MVDAQAIERDSGIDAVLASEGSVILVQCKSARKDVDVGLRRLAAVTRMVHHAESIILFCASSNACLPPPHRP